MAERPTLTGGAMKLSRSVSLQLVTPTVIQTTELDTMQPIRETRPTRKLDLSCLEFDSTKGFVETCTTVNAHLSAINDAFPEDQIVNPKELQHTQMQLSDKEVLISIFGRYSSGKSTLLNSIMGEMLLPVGFERETSVQVKIYHSSDVHKPGLCTKQHLDTIENPSCMECPRLLEYNEEKVANVVYGDSDILDRLQKWNNDVRENNKIIVPELCLYVHAPVLSGAPEGWKVCLVDNAGFGDATEHVAKLASRNMKFSSAYIYFVNANCLHDAVDSDLYKTLSIQDQNCFHEQRFFAVISKMDDCYLACKRPDTRERLTEEQIIAKVKDGVKNRTGYDIKNEDVIPVIGQWAQTAHLLTVPGKTEASREFYRTEALEGLKLHSHYHSSDMRRREDGYWKGQDHVQELASDLKAASGIQRLEKRIKRMSKRCIRVWTEKLSSDYLGYISKACKCLHKKRNELQDVIKQNFERIEAVKLKHDKVQCCINELIEELDEETSSAYKAFYEAYLTDIETSCVEANGKREVKLLVDTLKEDTKIKIRQRNRYGPEDLSRDLDFFHEKARSRLELMFNQVFVFTGLQKVSFRCCGDVAEKFCLMRTTIIDKHLSRRASTDASMDVVPGSRATGPNLGEVKQRTTDCIPQVQLSLFRRHLQLWLYCVVVDDHYRSWTAEHERLFETLSANILEECSNYFETIKLQIVKHYFRQYCQFTERKIRSFNGEIKHQLDEEALQMQQLKKQTDLLKKMEWDLQHMCKRLKDLKDHLIESKEQYLESQGYTT